MSKNTPNVLSASEVGERSEPIWAECQRYGARYARLYAGGLFIFNWFCKAFFIIIPQ